MIKINNNSNLVINKDRHTVKTTNEYSNLQYEYLVRELQDQGFQVIDYTEQNYYNRSISKNRHGKGLFRIDLVSPINPLIGISLSSSNDNQMSLYLHATIKGIPVKILNRIRHIASNVFDLDIKGMIQDLETLCNDFSTLAETEVKQGEILEAFQALNSYRAEIITNSAQFAPIQSANYWELFQNLADTMINGKGIITNEVKFTKKITHIRNQFRLGSKILDTLKVIKDQ